MCSFSVGQGFSLEKIQKFKGAPTQTSEFHQICANFDWIWHKHAGLRPACEHRAKRANIRANKKPWKCKSCENRAKPRETCEKPCEQTAWKKQVVRTSCERCEHFIQIPLLAEISPKKIPNFAQKSAYSNFWPKIAWVCSKNLNILFSDRKPPEFALKSAYWIFWPILARFFQKPAHFKFLSWKSLEFSQKTALFWLWQKLARLYPATCAS